MGYAEKHRKTFKGRKKVQFFKIAQIYSEKPDPFILKPDLCDEVFPAFQKKWLIGLEWGWVGNNTSLAL